MKFLADIPIARSTAARLSALGHDCLLVREAINPTATDSEIIASRLRNGV